MTDITVVIKPNQTIKVVISPNTSQAIRDLDIAKEGALGGGAESWQFECGY